MHRLVRRLWREWISSSHQQLVVSAAASFCEARPVLTHREHFLRLIGDSRQPCSSASFDSTFVADELNRIFDDNKRDPELVNHNLYQLLLEEDMIRVAHKSLVVAAGHEKDFYERRKLVREIAKELVDEKFQFEVLPKPTPHEDSRYFYQPPPFRDKLVVEAMRIVLEKIYEPIFLDSSHGFRPSRSRHTALMSCRRGLRHHRHALVGRLGGFNHHLLAQLLEQKIGDKRFIRLIWKALKAGYWNRNPHLWTVKDAWDGKPEATTLSTLFSNIFLHSLDCWVKLRIPNTMLFYVRYGDEFMFSVAANKPELLTLKKDLEDFLKQDMQLEIPDDFSVTRFAGSHAFFLGTKISVTAKAGVVGRVRLEAPMDRVILELAKLGMVSVGGTRPHPVTYLARCSHNEIISYYNWVMRGCCTYYSFVDNFYQLTSYLRLALRSSCVRTLTMKLKRFRAARTYKVFGTECAARYRAPIRNGHVVDDQLSDEEKSILKDRMKAVKRLRLEWEQLGAVEKGLLQRFIIPRRREEPNGDVNLEFRGDYLLYCSKNTEHEETKRALRKLELLPPAQNIWDFRETLVPPPRPRLSVDYEPLYPH